MMKVYQIYFVRRMVVNSIGVIKKKKLLKIFYQGVQSVRHEEGCSFDNIWQVAAEQG